MKRRLAASVTLAIAVAPAVEAGRAPTPATLADLASRSVAIHRDEPVTVAEGQAARSYEAFLDDPAADPALRAQALRRLGDLRLAEAEEYRARDGEDSPDVLQATRAAIAAYERWLAGPGTTSDADPVLYQLARAYEGIGDATKAQAILARLAAGNPAGAHFDEAQFRRGESLFAEGRYADAAVAYAAVVALGPQSGFYEQALYKRGWSLFKQSLDEESSEAFLQLLDIVLVSDGRLKAPASLSRAQQELSSDALRALSISFAASDGVDALRAAVSRHGAVVYEARLYASLGDLYVEKERYQDGAEAYRAYAAGRPLDPEAALLIVRATGAYAKGGFESLVRDGQRQLVEQYGPGSQYWRASAPQVDPDVSAAVAEALLDLARYHHALAQSGSARDRELAIRWYREYLDGFDAAPEAAHTRMLLADLLLDGQQYEPAAVEYELVAYGRAPSADSQRAAYAAVVAFGKAASLATDARRAELELRGVESGLQFAAAYPGSDDVPGVLARASQVLFDAGDRDRAAAVARQLLALGARADAGQQRLAWTIIAHTSFDAGRYAESESAYTELQRRVPPQDPQRREIDQRLAASVYRQAEAKQAAGDLDGAVREYLRVAAVAPGSEASATAEYDAAAALIGAGRWGDAIPVLERLRDGHPNDARRSEVTRRLALAYLEAGRGRDAASAFEAVADASELDAEVRRSALWQAAELYRSAHDADAAQRAYATYVSRYPSPLDPALEARQALADLAGESGDSKARGRWLAELVDAESAAGSGASERARTLAAAASLDIAHALDATARSVRLVVPLKKSLGAKTTALKSALAAYTRAAAYGVESVTTESTFAMADLYRELAAALVASERPPGLSAEELEQYALLVEEQAYPFEEKAIGIHEENARRAAGGVYDRWVRSSYSALAQLKPARYARDERLSGVAPATTLPEPVVASLAAARAALDSGDDATARAHAEDVLATDPACAEALNLLGVVERRQGRFRESRAAYERAIASAPDAAVTERNLGILLDLYLGEPAAALPHYERSQALAGDADPDIGPWLVELRTRLGPVSRTAEAQP